MEKKTVLLIFFCIFVISAVMRLQILRIYDKLPLSGDAPSFVNKAQNMKNFYAFWHKFERTVNPFYHNNMKNFYAFCHKFERNMNSFYLNNMKNFHAFCPRFERNVSPFYLREHNMKTYMFLSQVCYKCELFLP